MNYTYIVECGDGSLYTGWTNNLEKRIQAHNAGKGAKYTKSRLPVSVAAANTPARASANNLFFISFSYPPSFRWAKKCPLFYYIFFFLVKQSFYTN